MKRKMLSMKSSVSPPSSSRKYSAHRQRRKSTRADGPRAARSSGHRPARPSTSPTRFELITSRFFEFIPEIGAFTGAFTQRRRTPTHRRGFAGDVVDQLLDDDGLAHAGAAEQADLATLQKGLRSESMTLMPVSNISSTSRLTLRKFRRGRDGWATFPLRSLGRARRLGSPITFRMRPSVANAHREP